MYVVGHEHVGVDVASLAHGDLAQVLQVTHTIDVGEKARLAIIAALDDVLRYLGKIESWLARHGGIRAGVSPVSPRTMRRSAGSRHHPLSESAL